MLYKVTNKKTGQNLGTVTPEQKAKYEADPVTKGKYTFTLVAQPEHPVKRPTAPEPVEAAKETESKPPVKTA